MFAPEDLQTMGLLRRAFDPDNRANPGKVLPTPRTCGESAKRSVTLQSTVELF
jgi:glycolate oxidase